MYVETLKRISKALVDAPCTAIIAGGAVRDIDNGKPYKDIDIFCLYEEDRDPNHLVWDFAAHLGLRDVVIHNGHAEYQENWAGIHSVWDGRVVLMNYENGLQQLIDVQLVFQEIIEDEGADTPQLQVTSKFDLNICQAALEYDEGTERFYISKSDAYKRDKENGTITLTQHGLDLPVGPKRDKTRLRANRIANKLNFRTDLEWDNRRLIHANPIVGDDELQNLQVVYFNDRQLQFAPAIQINDHLFEVGPFRLGDNINGRVVAQYNNAGGLGEWRDIFG